MCLRRRRFRYVFAPSYSALRSFLCVRFGKEKERRSLTRSAVDYGQPEESGITRQADRVREGHQAVRYAVEPAVSGLLLPLREGGGDGGAEE